MESIVYSVDNVKQMFWCHQSLKSALNDDDFWQSCCNFINNYKVNTGDDGKSGSVRPSTSCLPELKKKIKTSKEKSENDLNDSSFQAQTTSSCCSVDNTCLNDEMKPDKSSCQFEKLLLLLSKHLNEINDCVQSLSERDFSETANAITVINSAFFNILYLVHHDLVKIKRFLTYKSIKRTKSSQKLDSENQCSQGSTGKSNPSISLDSYNQNIELILQHRFLILQLIHFECILLRYFTMAEHSLYSKFFSVYSHDLVQAKLQPVLRLYYSLQIKLTYEIPFLNYVMSIHRDSLHNSTKLLLLFFRLISPKLSENQSSNLSFIMESLLSPISNNYLIIAMLDYIYTMLKLGFEVLDKTSDDNLTINQDSDLFDVDKVQQLNFEYNNIFQNLIPNDVKLVDVCYFILSFFCTYQDRSIKSTVRFRTIEILVFITGQKTGLKQSLCCGSLLIQTIMDLLFNSMIHHCNVCDRPLLNLSKEKRLIKGELKLSKARLMSENELNIKQYRFVLRDIYGLLSLYLTMSEHIASKNLMLYSEIQQKLFEQFLTPFVESLNGSGYSDPENTSIPYIKNRPNAYMKLRTYNKQFKNIFKCIDRIIRFSSIIIQRLLPPLLLPVKDCCNPFIFKLPLEVENNENDLVGYEYDDTQFLLNFESDEDFDSEDDTEDDITNSANSSRREIEPSNSELNETNNIDLSRAYLNFYPEIKKFQWDSLGNQADASIEKVLACFCSESIDIPSIILPPEEKASFSSEEFAQSLNKSFVWSEVYHKEYQTTKGIIPRNVIPHPELNFVNQIYNPNKHVYPLSYPFMSQMTRRKNYHHVQLLNHIQERLTNPEPNYKTIYDIECPNLIQSDLGNYLKFESRFECGNLRKVLVNQNRMSQSKEEYILILNTDINSSSHTQWFYFSVTGMKCNTNYNFQIINCEKKSILFNYSQQPLFYSTKEFELTGKMWQRTGENDRISYYRNHYVRDTNTCVSKDRNFFTLEFTFTFPHQNDICYFAYNIPFSYTFLKANIAYWTHLVEQYNSRLDNPDQLGTYFAVQALCSSLNGNVLPVMTITSQNHLNCPLKPHYVVLTARVHPSESNSSWMLKGFIDFLLHPSMKMKDEQLRKQLLQNYVFKIIPMLNPEGVINGCTRTDLQTHDLNRYWNNPSSLLHPTIYHSKQLLKCLHKFSSCQNPVAYLDLHGHSRLHNIFSYGCFSNLSWKLSDRQQYLKQSMQSHICVCPLKEASSCQLKNLFTKLKLKKSNEKYHLIPASMTYPVLLHLQQAPAFDIENCSFVIQRDREHTARVVCWREFDIPLSYTIECSAAGCESGPYGGIHLNTYMMEEMGRYLASSFAFIIFLHCNNRHFPVIAMPDKPNTNNEAFLENLMLKCFRGVKPRLTLTQRQKRQKQKLLQMYPDLNTLNCHPPVANENLI